MEDIIPEYAVDKRIFNKLKELLKRQLDAHCKVLVSRADVRYPKGTGYKDNKDITRCMDLTNRVLKDKGIDYDRAFIREEGNSSDAPHFHLVYMSDGNKLRNSKFINKIISENWKKVINAENDGLIDYCTRSKNGEKHFNSVMVHRNKEIPREAVLKLSYPAKPSNKGKIGDGVRNFGTSQPRKSKKTKTAPEE